MKIHIKDFIKTGEFGYVKIGITKQDLMQSLGEPDDVAGMGKNGQILRYSWYEFYISAENKLYAIQNDNFNPRNPESYTFKNEIFEIDSWFLNEKKNQTMDAISQLLEAENIPYKIVDYWGRDVIKAESGVVIDVDEEDKDENRKLTGIRYWPEL